MPADSLRGPEGPEVERRRAVLPAARRAVTVAPLLLLRCRRIEADASAARGLWSVRVFTPYVVVRARRTDRARSPLRGWAHAGLDLRQLAPDGLEFLHGGRHAERAGFELDPLFLPATNRRL